MTKTLADLKRDFESKKIVLTMLRRYGEETIPERLQGERKVVKTQSNGVYLTAKDAPRGSWLEYPKAAQLYYDGDMLIIYDVGMRDYNQKELDALAEWKKITDTDEYKEQAYCDCMTDCSTTFYKQKAFWRSKGMEYMFYEDKGGLRRDINENKIYDNTLRGKELFAYKVRLEA